MFGEIAIAAARLASNDNERDDEIFWKRIATDSVSAQRIYYKAYPCKVQNGQLATYRDYSPCTFTGIPNNVDLATIATPIAEEADIHEIERAAAMNYLHAFPGQIP
ncbi:MAG: hypothetical protein Phyf2KO_11340 [Phycisphaerales bacterium]